VTVHMVDNWARFDGLRKVRMADDDGRPQVRYPLIEAALIDKAKRDTKRGRTRAA
jgi:hypothetical protein